VTTSTIEKAETYGLEPWGLSPHFTALFSTWREEHPEVRAVVGRVASWEHGLAEVLVGGWDEPCQLSDQNVDPHAALHANQVRRCSCEPLGTLRKQLLDGELATGDWVVLDADSLKADAKATATMIAMLPRKSQLRRRMAGTIPRAQTVASNIDKVLIVTSANNEFSARRLERYLVAVWDSGSKPVVVLNKIDLTPNVDGFLREIFAVVGDVQVVSVSAHSCQGLAELVTVIGPGETVALVGSSGVGKSSLLNRLAGRVVAATGGIDSLDKGRHTTTSRSMVLLPQGGVLIDNPGMREFGLLDSEGALDIVFTDIGALAAHCRFSDCAHLGEPGCAVRHAIERGELDEHRFQSFQKLEREMEALRARTDPRLQSARRQANKIRARAHRAKNTSKNTR
jgi:ribosome biogenesis GTPase / thiamine phosphate phosphatase